LPRQLPVLVLVLSVAALVAATVLFVRDWRVSTQGVRTEATALGVSPNGADSGVYVRFLWGSEATIGTAAAPLWQPDHGARVQVAFHPADPAGSVAIVDTRAGGLYLLPAVAGLAGLLGIIAVLISYRHAQPPKEESS